MSERSEFMPTERPLGRRAAMGFGGAAPVHHERGEELEVVPIIRAEGLTVHYKRRVGSRMKTVHALDDFDLEIFPGETVGLVGESGCGKTTAGRALLGAVPATSGKVFYNGRDITSCVAASGGRCARTSS